MLADIYGWLTEGFDTADLMDAKALLAANEIDYQESRKLPRVMASNLLVLEAHVVEMSD